MGCEGYYELEILELEILELVVDDVPYGFAAPKF